MTTTKIDWCGYFSTWRRFEERGQIYLEPPSGVITAGDFHAAEKSGVVHARVQYRATPNVGVYLAFAPSPSWHEYARLHPVADDGRPGSGSTDVVDMDFIDGDIGDRTPTPRDGFPVVALPFGGRS